MWLSPSRILGGPGSPNGSGGLGSAHFPGMCQRDRGGGCSILALIGCLPLPDGTADPLWTSACTSFTGPGRRRRGSCQSTPRIWSSEPQLAVVADPAGGQCQEIPVGARSCGFSCKGWFPGDQAAAQPRLRGPQIRAKGAASFAVSRRTAWAGLAGASQPLLLPCALPRAQEGQPLGSEPGSLPAQGFLPQLRPFLPAWGRSPLGPRACCSVAPSPAGSVNATSSRRPSPPAPSPRTRAGEGPILVPFPPLAAPVPLAHSWTQSGFPQGCDPGRSSQARSAL